MQWPLKPVRFNTRAPIIIPTAALLASDRLLYQARRVALLQIKFHDQVKIHVIHDPLNI